MVDREDKGVGRMQVTSSVHQRISLGGRPGVTLMWEWAWAGGGPEEGATRDWRNSTVIVQDRGPEREVQEVGGKDNQVGQA